MYLRTLCPLLLLAGSLAAQNPFTSPAGLLTTEGSSNHTYILFKYNDMRFQQLDEMSVGLGPNVIQRISWRRDGPTAANAAWTARTIDTTVIMSNAVKPVAISPTMDANYSGTPSTVFALNTVNLPDWTQQPASTPAPFDFVVPFSQPWLYTGLEPFLWEVRGVNNSAVGSDYGNDFQSITGSTGTSNSGSILGTGCIAGGQTTAMALTGTLNNQYTRFRFAYTVARAPATTPVVLFIDGANANLTVPGLCTTLFALPTLQVPMGNSDSLGAATVAIDNVGYSAAAIGASIFSQAVALDATQVGIPVALSNGRNHTFPAQPATPAAVTRGYEYTINTTNAFRAASVWTGGIVTRFD